MTPTAIEPANPEARPSGPFEPDADGYDRREGDSFYFKARTDKKESEHRCDCQSYCTCWGFIHWRHCKHSDRVREIMQDKTTEHTSALATTLPPALQVHRSPQELAVRLAEMVQERGLVATFFKDVMEEGHDYGIIPGTDKPTLFKPGAEKLAELYGYSPTVKDRQETTDFDTGFYRVVMTLALVSKDTGVVVAEGVGECNTREARYFYRWVSANKIPAGMDKALLKQEKRKGKFGEYTVYRLENDDLFTLWNTVLKMAKKRALVDAVLSATRSSGIFGRSPKEVQEWIEAEYADISDFDDDPEDDDRPPTPPEVSAPPKPTRPAPPDPEPPLAISHEDAKPPDTTPPLERMRQASAARQSSAFADDGSPEPQEPGR